MRGHAAKYLHSKTPMTTSTQVFTGQEGSLGAGFFLLFFYHTINVEPTIFQTFVSYYFQSSRRRSLPANF